PLSTRHSHPPSLPPFPTRRSSDLLPSPGVPEEGRCWRLSACDHRLAHRALREPVERINAIGRSRFFAQQQWNFRAAQDDAVDAADRKSTRLNSSHVASSYAVFCLK